MNTASPKSDVKRKSKPPLNSPASSAPIGRPATTGQLLSEPGTGYLASLVPLVGAAAALRRGRITPLKSILTGIGLPITQFLGGLMGFNAMQQRNVSQQMSGFSIPHDKDAAWPDHKQLATQSWLPSPSARNNDRTPNRFARTSAVAGTAGKPAGSVGAATHGPMKLLQLIMGNLGAHGVGGYFLHPKIQSELLKPAISKKGGPLGSKANQNVAGGEVGYWSLVHQMYPSFGSSLAMMFSKDARSRIQATSAKGNNTSAQILEESVKHVFFGSSGKKAPRKQN